MSFLPFVSFVYFVVPRLRFDPDLSNFAEWHRHLRQDSSAATDELRLSLQEVIDGFEGLYLKGPPSGTRLLQVAVRTGGDGNCHHRR